MFKASEIFFSSVFVREYVHDSTKSIKVSDGKVRKLHILDFLSEFGKTTHSLVMFSSAYRIHFTPVMSHPINHPRKMLSTDAILIDRAETVKCYILLKFNAN